VEIVQGVKAGDRFVANGAAFLADGNTVRVVDAAKVMPNVAKAQ
jgi:hypothetical protein